MTKDAIVGAIDKHAKDSGIKTLNGKSVEKPTDNLVMEFSNWSTVENEIKNGGGKEFEKGEKGFLSLHSSCALCVNNFSQIKNIIESGSDKSFDLLGLGVFKTCNFEKPLSTGLSDAYPDVYFTNEETKTICAVESKFTEIFDSYIADHKYNTDDKVGNLTNYKNQFQKIVAKGAPKDFESDVLDYYIKKSESLNLDVAQLIKHSLGLLIKKAETKQSPILLYIYWRPEEPGKEYDKLEAQLKEFDTVIGKYLCFEWRTYNELWDYYKDNAQLKKVVELNMARYKL